MTDTAARLEAYKQAELRALDAQQSRKGDRWRINAELAEIRKAITELTAQLAAEQAAANGRVGPAFAVADFSRAL
jgi:hypothetical protein